MEMEKDFIAAVYAVERPNERENIKQHYDKGNKMLLWHGTRKENLVGIMQTGFRIAPSNAARTGSMFGEGNPTTLFNPPRCLLL